MLFIYYVQLYTKSIKVLRRNNMEINNKYTFVKFMLTYNITHIRQVKKRISNLKNIQYL